MLVKNQIFINNSLSGLRFPWAKPALFIFAAVMLLSGGMGSGLYARPQSTLFFEMFVKEGMLPLVVASIFWFIVLVRARPERLEEFQYLNSLPFSHNRLADHFLQQELVRYAWAPAAPIVILWTPASFAPFAHICRISLVLLLWYALIFAAFANAAFVFPSRRFNALIRYNPIFAFFAVFLFAAGTLPIVLLDDLLSGTSFWLVFSGFAGAIFFLWMLFRKAATAWHKKNGLYRTGSSTNLSKSGLVFLSFVNFKSALSPFLVKNVLKMTRENSVLVTSLTAIYILGGYLVSRNNERLDDFLAILLTVALLYAVFFSIKSQSFFAESVESRQIIHVLPLKKSKVYLSVYLPAVIWIVLITTIFTLLAVVTRIGAISSFLFWLKASALSLVFVTAAFNYAFGAYPDEKKGQTRFVVWGLALLVFIALFYRYRYLVLLLMLVLSFGGVLRRRLYRTK